MKVLIFVMVFLIVLVPTCSTNARPVKANPPTSYTIEQLLNAMEVVESDENEKAVGDNGKSIGILQIQEAYWKDAQMLDGTYQDCFKREYARRVVKAYWKRYAPTALKNVDGQTLTRIHNGGPNGVKNPKTAKYWKKVQAEL